MYDIFGDLPRRVVTMTEGGFNGFRDSLERSGFTLREIERVPHHEPESVR